MSFNNNKLFMLIINKQLTIKKYKNQIIAKMIMK